MAKLVNVTHKEFCESGAEGPGLISKHDMLTTDGNYKYQQICLEVGAVLAAKAKAYRVRNKVTLADAGVSNWMEPDKAKETLGNLLLDIYKDVDCAIFDIDIDRVTSTANVTLGIDLEVQCNSWSWYMAKEYLVVRANPNSEEAGFIQVNLVCSSLCVFEKADEQKGIPDNLVLWDFFESGEETGTPASWVRRASLGVGTKHDSAVYYDLDIAHFKSALNVQKSGKELLEASVALEYSKEGTGWRPLSFWEVQKRAKVAQALAMEAITCERYGYRVPCEDMEARLREIGYDADVAIGDLKTGVGLEIRIHFKKVGLVCITPMKYSSFDSINHIRHTDVFMVYNLDLAAMTYLFSVVEPDFSENISDPKCGWHGDFEQLAD